jgi:excisionase family DNA binding protein
MPRLKKKYMPKYAEKPVVMPPPVADCPKQWPQYMDYHTAAEYISETYWTIRNLVQSRKLIAKKIGRRFTVARAELDELWLKTEKVPTKKIA